RARELGLTESYFANATGLPDPTLLVTARELGRLAQHIIKTYPEFYPIYGEKEFTWNKIRQQIRNPLLAMNLGADGLKTGFTQDGGYGLVGSAVQNGLRLIVVVNGLKSANERAEAAKRLLEWGFKGFEARYLFAEGQTIGDAKLFGGAHGSVPLVARGHANDTMRGRFITCEGGEGAGKSTQAELLAERLRTLAIGVVVTREPGGSAGAEAIRHVLLSGAAKPLGPEVETMLFAAARDDHIQATIRPAPAQGKREHSG